MIRANLNYNYHFPFYTLSSFGKKKYSHSEKVCIHLSRKRRFIFKLSYNSGKLSEINYEHEKDKYFDLYNKEVKHIPYVDFAVKMKAFENFLMGGLKQLGKEKAYYKTLVFSEGYKFNNTLELSFTYGKLHLRKGNFPFSIEDGKLNKPKRDNGTDSDLDKVERYLDAWDSNYFFEEMGEEKFYNYLKSVMGCYVDFLTAPTVLRKNEYTEKNIPK